MANKCGEKMTAIAVIPAKAGIQDWAPAFAGATTWHNRVMARRIALVEDDSTIRQNYAEALVRAGYDVAAFGDRAGASRALATRLPELAIIDIGLGADDYLTKDVSLPHLLARIAALFRRLDAAAAAPASEDVINRGKLALDAQRMQATWDGKPVPLTVTEFWMVRSLARHPGHVKDRDQLMRDAEMVVDDGTITSHVKRIRKKFLAVDPAFDAIETVYGMGYRWLAAAG